MRWRRGRASKAASMANASRSVAGQSWSSSAMSDRSFTSFLVESFATLRRELPDVYRALCRHFDRREVTITVADELVVLRFEAQQVRRVAHALHPAITVATSKDSILSLVNARVTLVDAVL